MGFIKDVNQPTGFTTSYTNVQRIISMVFREDKTASCELRVGMYKDKEARKSGTQPVMKDERFTIEGPKAAILKRVLYESLRDQYANAEDHIEQGDPDMSQLVTFLKDWEVKVLLARVEKEMADRSLTPLTDAEIQAYYDGLDSTTTDTTTEPAP